jgi:ABC-type transport system substrate-binding protein
LIAICSTGAALLVLGLAQAAMAQRPLYEQSPYDEITLRNNKRSVIKVEPIDFPKRRVPVPLPTSGKLKVWVVGKADAYEVRWSLVEKIELFETLVLKEAVSRIQAGRLAEAYDYFQWLLAEDPQLPGLKKAIDDYLYEEAKARHVSGQYDGALAMLLQLRERDPQRPELDNALGRATEALVDRYAAAEDYFSARRLIANLAKMYPDHAVVAAWRSRWNAEADKLVGEARQTLSAGDARQAERLARRAANIAPSSPQVREMLVLAHEKYPRMTVGVSIAATSFEPLALADWAARRSSRLLHRTLMEYVGPGPEGGRYRCPMGTMEVRELGLRLAFELRPGLRWSTGDAVLTGYDLSRRLLALADPREADYRSQWADIFAGASVRDVYTVYADLSRPHVRPEAFLQATLVPYTNVGEAPEGPWSNGPCRVESRSENETVYVANTQYFAATPTQPKEITERVFLRTTDAIQAIQRREIDAFDRINPWDLDLVRGLKDVTVARYAAPRVHGLIPNLKKTLLQNRQFRRALEYGINRQEILEDLLGGQEVEGCQVVSGPFSPGIRLGDGLDYAYDYTIEPRPYDPRLAIALTQLAVREWQKTEAAASRPVTKLPVLALAYPSHPIAYRAVRSIQRQLGLVGIKVELKKLSPHESFPMPGDIDLVYAELAMWEPVVDARRLLDVDGLSGGASPYMTLALQQLEQARQWRDISGKLREIHRLAQSDVAVVPLWQLTDHFAYHRSLQGIGNDPVTLYDNVEAWQREVHFPSEAE